MSKTILNMFSNNSSGQLEAREHEERCYKLSKSRFTHRIRKWYNCRVEALSGRMCPTCAQWLAPVPLLIPALFLGSAPHYRLVELVQTSIHFYLTKVWAIFMANRFQHSIYVLQLRGGSIFILIRRSFKILSWIWLQF